MRMSLGNGVVQLVEGSPLSLRGARGFLLECTEGRVWCTLDGMSQDFVFGMGERVRIENNGLVLVTGSPCGSIRLISEVPLPSRWGNKVIKPLHDLGCLGGASGMTHGRVQRSCKKGELPHLSVNSLHSY
jgi:hypothetical protein